MYHRTVATAAAIGFSVLLTAPIATAGPADPAIIPPRTAFSVRSTTGIAWGTANEYDARSSLSLAKLYLADYALRHGDGSDTDRKLAERMICCSDDAAADTIAAKYPAAIDATATEYHLTATESGDSWGDSATSTADVATFLESKLRTDPTSPILQWMAAADATAADGTEQNWGTTQWPGVLGTKWGWSDFGEQEVASASYGPGFAIAAHTRGTPAEQTADILNALPIITLQMLGQTRFR